jgi:hypothetical protein
MSVDDRHLLDRELDELVAELDPPRVVERDLADLLDDAVELGMLPARPVARGLDRPLRRTNCECQLSRKKDRSGWPPQVSTLQLMIVS